MSQEEHKIMVGSELSIKVCEAMGLDVNRTSRIVIELTPFQPVAVYVEMLGDTRLLEVDWGMDGARVYFADRERDE